MRAGFLMLALAFPIYLLWKGELPAYLKLMAGAGASGTGGADTATKMIPGSQPGTVQPGIPFTPDMSPGDPNIPFMAIP